MQRSKPYDEDNVIEMLSRNGKPSQVFHIFLSLKKSCELLQQCKRQDNDRTFA